MANDLLASNVVSLNVPKSVQDVYMSSISIKTKQLYILYIKRWISFCVEKGFCYKVPTIRTLLLFLSSLVRRKVCYSAVNIARSAISFFAPKVEGAKIGVHPDICRFLLGVKKSSPVLSKYLAIWDVDLVLKFLVELWPLKPLPLTLLIKKFVMLFLLVTSHRVQSLQVLKLSKLVWVREDLVVFILDERLKHVRNQELGFI